MTVKRLLYPFSFLQKQLRELYTRGSVIEKLYFILYLFSSISLFLYSYTQIDLGLVITRVPWLYAVEKKFQYIGYFNRPLSALLFVCLTLIFFSLYLSLLRLVQKGKIKISTIWSIIGVVTIILTFSYNAFSYDLFNYIFDAKILAHYHQNPYVHKALDYPMDPMLGFMHWTHRTYPYGPFWLVVTVPLSFIGANIFIVTFFLFKILMSGSFLVLLFYLYRLLQKSNKKNVVGNVVLFALNPLILFEFLISAHNDVVMIAFSIAALYFLQQKKYWSSFILLVISIGIKFATIALLPVFLLVLWQQRTKRKSLEYNLYLLCLAFMAFPLVFVTMRTTFQPWYLLYVLPFIPFVTQRFIRYLVIFIAAGSLFLYTPFLATGDWHSRWYTIPESILYWFIFAGTIGGGVYVLYRVYRTFIIAIKNN